MPKSARICFCRLCPNTQNGPSHGPSCSAGPAGRRALSEPGHLPSHHISWRIRGPYCPLSSSYFLGQPRSRCQGLGARGPWDPGLVITQGLCPPHLLAAPLGSTVAGPLPAHAQARPRQRGQRTPSPPPSCVCTLTGARAEARPPPKGGPPLPVSESAPPPEPRLPSTLRRSQWGQSG